MKILLALSTMLCITSAKAQFDDFYGHYFIAAIGEDSSIVLEQNCWSMEIDGVYIGETNYESYQIELIFQGFHSVSGMGKVLESSSNALQFDLIDPDMVDSKYEIYTIVKMEEGLFMLVCETDGSNYLLVPIDDLKKYVVVPCPEESPVEEGEE